jgi:hypothetical protein
MKISLFVTLFTFCSIVVYAQKPDMATKDHLPEPYISFTPFNILFFQQAGITYEYKPGRFGYGNTAGHINPNRKEYSNWFITGPVK